MSAGDADVERVLVEALQQTLGIHLPSCLQTRGKGAVDSAIVELRRTAQGRYERGRFREGASARGNHRGKNGLCFGIFVGLHKKSAQACGAVPIPPKISDRARSPVRCRRWESSLHWDRMTALPRMLRRYSPGSGIGVIPVSSGTSG